jgi:hypothetical protein
MALNELTWFTAVGYVYDVEQPNPGGVTNQPVLLNVSAYVDFFPGTQANSFPTGHAVLVADLDHGDGTSGDTMVPLAPITARLMNGALCAVAVGDPIGQQLLAGSTILNLASPLYYHVRWRNVTYGGAVQAISDFAFAAPTGGEAPANLVGTPSATGGALPAGTYFWAVTAVMPWGETAVSNIVSETLTGTTSSVALSWSNVVGALGYNVYRGVAGNALNTLVAEITSGATHSYTAVGAAGSAVSAPLTDIVDITSPTLQTTTYGGP